ncbi:hypothetical protein [Methyloceanibacter stevinii]|nr:hypothetical protein [Methyloceanibacter stevinii]
MTSSLQKAFARVCLAGSCLTRSCLTCALLLSLCLVVLGTPAARAQDAPDDAEAATEPTEQASEEAEEPTAAWDISKPCANVQHPYQADVCQQSRAADASESTARLTRLIMLIGLVALVILLLMLWPIITAALAARRAAEGGAAPARLTPAPRTGDHEAELRAYVDVDSLEFVETPEADGIVKVKVTFRNSGHTPAFKLETLAEMEVVDIADEADLPVKAVPDDSAPASSRPRVGRDGTTTLIVQCASTPKLADRVTNGEATILVWGAAGYYDVFDRRRRTIFQYFCNAETLDTGEMFRPWSAATNLGRSLVSSGASSTGPAALACVLA